MQFNIFVCAVEKLKLRIKLGRNYVSSNRFVRLVVRGKNRESLPRESFKRKIRLRIVYLFR